MPLHPLFAGIFASTLPPTGDSRAALLRDLQNFVEDVGNLAADQGWNHIEHRADSLFVRLRRELEG